MGRMCGASWWHLHERRGGSETKRVGSIAELSQVSGAPAVLQSHRRLVDGEAYQSYRPEQQEHLKDVPHPAKERAPIHCSSASQLELAVDCAQDLRKRHRTTKLVRSDQNLAPCMTTASQTSCCLLDPEHRPKSR